MPDLNNAQSVQLLDRAFGILELLSSNKRMSLKEIYTKLELNKASTLRIMSALCANNYVHKDPRSGDYSLSFKCYEIGIKAVGMFNHINFIREALDSLAFSLNVIAQFSVDEYGSLLCLESFDNTHSNLTVYTKVGQRSPLYATSAGKAILSTYSEEEVRQLWPRMNVKVFTPNTITSLDDFLKELAVIRQQGYALDMEETELGLFCLGMPLLDNTGRAIGAISLSTSCMDQETINRLRNGLSTQVRRLAYLLSY